MMIMAQWRPLWTQQSGRSTDFQASAPPSAHANKHKISPSLCWTLQSAANTRHRRNSSVTPPLRWSEQNFASFTFRPGAGIAQSL